MSFLAQEPSPADEISSLTGDILLVLQLLFVFAAVLILAVVVIRYWLPRLMGTTPTNAGVIEVVARHFLDTKKGFYLIKVKEEFFLIGVWDGGMTFLTALDSEGLKNLEIPEGSPRSPLKDFRSLIRWREGND